MNARFFSLPVAVALVAAAFTPDPLRAQGPLAERTQKILDRIKKERKSAARPASAPAVQATIIGLCGLRLGDRMPAGRLVSAEENRLSYQFSPTPELSGLTFYNVGLTPQTNRIAHLQALSTGAEPGTAEKVLEQLKAQLGPAPQRHDTGDGGVTWEWSQGQRTATLIASGEFVQVEVSDDGLLEEGTREMAQWKARPVVLASLGGPAYLSGTTMDGIFGLPLGQVFPPPAGVKAEGDELSFKMAPRQPLPGFTEYTVGVSAKTHRVLWAYGYADKLTEAQIRTLIADLSARLGPPSARERSKEEGSKVSSIYWKSFYPAGTNRSLELMVHGDGDTVVVLTDKSLTEQLRGEAGEAPTEAAKPRKAKRSAAVPNPAPAGASSQAPAAAGAPADSQTRERQDLVRLLGRLPGLSPELRNSLAGMAGRANGLGCVIAVPFPPGASSLAAGEDGVLADAVRTGTVRQILDNPKATLLIVGYAERESADRAQALSTERSQTVLRIFRDRGGVTNLMYGFGAGTAERVLRQGTGSVEVWAINP